MILKEASQGLYIHRCRIPHISLAAMEFAKKCKDTFTFTITQVVGLTNDSEVSKEFRPYKQMIERLNRTYKAS